MTRYYFHLYNDEILRDEEGAEFADLAAARAAAEQEAIYQAAVSLRMHHHLVLNHRLVIHDGQAEVATVRFGDVISVRES